MKKTDEKDNEAFDALVAELDECYAKLDEISEKIDEYKNEVSCPDCGVKSKSAATFLVVLNTSSKKLIVKTPFSRAAT